jgi:hypothetical protein
MKTRPAPKNKSRRVYASSSRSKESRYGDAVSNRQIAFPKAEDDANAFRLIKKMAWVASRNAISEARALGIERVYAKDDRLVVVSVDGEIRELTPVFERTYFFSLCEPSTVLNAL